MVTRQVPWEGLTPVQISTAVAPKLPKIADDCPPEVAAYMRAHAEEPQRLPIPDGCHEGLAALMRDCWAHEAAARPSFAEVARRLKEMS